MLKGVFFTFSKGPIWYNNRKAASMPFVYPYPPLRFSTGDAAVSYTHLDVYKRQLLRELFKAVLQIFSHFGGGVVGLFIERKNNAVVFPHFGIGFGRVIRNEDVGHIPQVNGCLLYTSI